MRQWPGAGLAEAHICSFECTWCSACATAMNMFARTAAVNWSGARAGGRRHSAMTRRLISSGSSFEKVAGYSRAVVEGEWVFVAGTTGFDYAAMSISKDLGEQVHQAFRNVGAALHQAGASLADVVRANYIMTQRRRLGGDCAHPGALFRRDPSCLHRYCRRARRQADALRDRGDRAPAQRGLMAAIGKIPAT